MTRSYLSHLLAASAALVVATAAPPTQAQPIEPEPEQTPPELPPSPPTAAPTPEPAPTQPPPPPPAYAPGPPTGAVPTYAPPPPPPSEPLGYRLHDGFYLRLGLGLGAMQTSRESEAAVPDSTIGGLAGSFDVMAGGTPSDGLVIGGALMINSAPEPTVDVRDEQFTSQNTLSFFMVGFMIDGFPNPEDGFHVGGAIGPAMVQLTTEEGIARDNSSGYGAAVWVGYDAWLSANWSIGGLLRMSGAATSNTEDGSGIEISDSTGSVALMFTALYH